MPPAAATNAAALTLAQATGVASQLWVGELLQQAFNLAVGSLAAATAINPRQWVVVRKQLERHPQLLVWMPKGRGHRRRRLWCHGQNIGNGFGPLCSGERRWCNGGGVSAKRRAALLQRLAGVRCQQGIRDCFGVSSKDRHLQSLWCWCQSLWYSSTALAGQPCSPYGFNGHRF